MSVTGIELLNGHDLWDTRTSPEFFCINNTSNAVCHVSINGGDHVTIYCDGDMRLVLDEQDICDCYELIDAGITTDADLIAIYDEFEDGSRVIMNPWFDIYDSEGEHLDIVSYDIYQAIEDAKIYLRKKELSNDKKTEV
jgi:hypothetical protein